MEDLGRPGILGTDDEVLHHGRFEDYLARTDAVALVAEADGDVIGFCSLEFRQRLHFSSEQAWIPDLIVDEEHRSRGAGAALLARADEISRERGCWGITLESATWRTRAHAFYEREGYEASGLAFNRSLSDIPWPPQPPDA